MASGAAARRPFAVGEVVAAVSRLTVGDAAIAELDLNLVITGPTGALAVDALVVVGGATLPM